MDIIKFRPSYLLILVGVVVFISSSSNACACSCSGREIPTKAYREASAVFVGTVTAISRATDRDGFSDRRVRFVVETPLKNSKTDPVDVYTSSQGTACGLPFEEGIRYLIFAYSSDKSEALQTSICTRTRAVRLGAIDDEVEVLRSLSKGRLEPRIYGTVYELTRGIYPLREDYWDSRRPIKGVIVRANNGSRDFKTVTDEEGRFTFTHVLPGEYRINFQVPLGYKVGGDEWDESTDELRERQKNIRVAVTASDSPDTITAEVRVDGRISGVILDQFGKPVGKEIPVTLVSKESAAKEVGDIDYVQAYTDSKGRYEFFGIPKGEYYLGLNIETKPHKSFPYPRTYFPSAVRISEATSISLGNGQRLTGYDLRLPAKVTEVEVRGTVVDGAGNPVKGAIVETYGLYMAPWRAEDGYGMRYVKQPEFEGRVETDENGAFVLRLLEGNRYRLNPFLAEKGSYKDILRGDQVDVDVTGVVKPVTLVLNQKPD